MSDKLENLMYEAGLLADGCWEEMDDYDKKAIEKFAELIVLETIKQMAIQMDKFGDDQSNNPDWYKSEETVKKYFGVKE